MYREHQEYGLEMREKFERYKNELPRDSYMDWYGWVLPVKVDPRFADTHVEVPEAWKNIFARDYITKIGRLDLTVTDVYDHRVASKCAEAISIAAEPFMLTCSFNMPHDPNVVPEPYYGETDADSIEADASLPCDAFYSSDESKTIPERSGQFFLREFLRVYYASIKFVDDQIGRLLSALRERGIADDTVVIFTADHGDMAGGHGMFWKSTKAFYQEVARVPLIVSAPGAPKSKRCLTPVELTDLMPTILDLCKIKAPDDLDGQSLVPALAGNPLAKNSALCERLVPLPGNIRRARVCDSEYAFMIRTQRHKYVLHRENGALTSMLYDLENDPRENENLVLSGKNGALERRMRSLLAERLGEGGYRLE